MSFCQWSSVLGHQQGVSFAICASVLLDELVSESSNNKDSSLREEYQGNSSTSSSSSDITLLSVSDSSSSRSEISEVSSVDSTSIIDELLWQPYFMFLICP